MRWLALMAVLLLSGCGEGYVAPTAELRVEFESESELNSASVAMQDELTRLGFEVRPSTEYGLADAINAPSPDTQPRASHNMTFWRHTSVPVDSDMHGDMTSFLASNGSAAEAVDSAQFPYVYISLSDITPGGFSPEGLRIYNEFMGFLQENNYRVTVITPAPPTNEKEKARIERVNLVAAVGWWMAVWSLSMAVLGGLAMWLLRANKAGQTVRRIALVAVGVLLVTPFPASSAFVAVLLPNALVLLFGPSFYTDLWIEADKMIVYPLMASTCLSLVAAFLFVRERRTLPVDR
jgi:hypothetical protein